MRKAHFAGFNFAPKRQVKLKHLIENEYDMTITGSPWGDLALITAGLILFLIIIY